MPDKKIKMIMESCEEQLREILTNIDIEELIEIFVLLKKKRAYSWKDRMLLQMIDKTPNLTFWASDKNYNVCIWAGQCNNVYGKDYSGQPFYDFISPLERANAMEDSMLVINKSEDEVGRYIKSFENYYTNDIIGRNTKVELITNSVQLIDEDNGETYYGEVGLHLNLEDVKKRYLEQQTDLEKKKSFTEKEWEQVIYEFDSRKEGLNSYLDKLNLKRQDKSKFVKKINDLQENLSKDVDSKKSKWVDTYQDDIKVIRTEYELKFDEIEEAIELKKINDNLEDPNKDLQKELLEARIGTVKETIENSFNTRMNSLVGGGVDIEAVEQRIKARLDELKTKKNEFIGRLTMLENEINRLPLRSEMIKYQMKIIEIFDKEVTDYLEQEEAQYDQ